jgi:hypothetical protein
MADLVDQYVARARELGQGIAIREFREWVREKLAQQ